MRVWQPTSIAWAILFLGCCGGNDVSVSATATGADVTVSTESTAHKDARCVSVTVTSQPTLVPVFIPMPIPYMTLAEKP